MQSQYGCVKVCSFASMRDDCIATASAQSAPQSKELALAMHPALSECQEVARLCHIMSHW